MMPLARNCALAGLFAGWLAGCAAGGSAVGGARPPQGPGPGGTEFGYWMRDAEGAVDASFRSHVSRTYDIGEESRARGTLERDSFTCRDGNRPDGAPVPALECSRLYKLNDDVHAWTVEFWPADREPKARYTRTHIRDPSRRYDEKRK